MKSKISKICKHCKQLKKKHETWLATGEYAEETVCPTEDMDESGRYRKLNFFEPMDNLEYLEWHYEKKEI